MESRNLQKENNEGGYTILEREGRVMKDISIAIACTIFPKILEFRSMPK